MIIVMMWFKKVTRENPDELGWWIQLAITASSLEYCLEPLFLCCGGKIQGDLAPACNEVSLGPVSSPGPDTKCNSCSI